MEMKRDSNYHAADRKIFIHGLHGKDGDDSSSWDSSDPEAVLNKLQGKPQVKGKKKDKDKVRSSADVDKDKYLKFADEKCRACGNIFMEDSVYCRKCGTARAQRLQDEEQKRKDEEQTRKEEELTRREEEQKRKEEELKRKEEHTRKEELGQKRKEEQQKRKEEQKRKEDQTRKEEDLKRKEEAQKRKESEAEEDVPPPPPPFDDEGGLGLKRDRELKKKMEMQLDVKCRRCKTEFDDDAVFCRKCGLRRPETEVEKVLPSLEKKAAEIAAAWKIQNMFKDIKRSPQERVFHKKKAYTKRPAVSCRRCKLEFDEDAVFCRKCGFKRPDVEVEKMTTGLEQKVKEIQATWNIQNQWKKKKEVVMRKAVKCTRCKKEFDDDAVFCRKCGYKRPDEMVEVSSGSDEEKAKLRRDGLMWGLANEKGKERENSSEYYSAYVSIEGEDHKRHRKRIHNKVKDKAKKFGKLAAKAKLEKKEEKQKKKKALENDVDRETERREGVLQDMMQKKKKTKSKKDKDDSSSDEYESYYVSKDGSEHDIHRRRLRRKLQEKARGFGQLINKKKQEDLKELDNDSEDSVERREKLFKGMAVNIKKEQAEVLQEIAGKKQGLLLDLMGGVQHKPKKKKDGDGGSSEEYGYESAYVSIGGDDDSSSW